MNKRPRNNKINKKAGGKPKSKKVGGFKKPLPKKQPKKTKHKDSIRINKYLADMGMTTRKGADELVDLGLVLVNNIPAKLGQQIKDGDIVTVVGKESFKKDYKYFIYNKPRGVVTVGKQAGEREILDLINVDNGFFPVGRLDKDSTGLIFITNDPRITNRLLSPKFEHEKEYFVEVDRDITNTFLAGLKEGVIIGYKEKTKPALVKKVNERSFNIVITEGKNRQIRRMCKAFGYEVVKLRRFRIMNIQDPKLRVGELKEISGKKLQGFLSDLGLE